MSELSEFGIVELIRLSREELLAQLLQTQLKRPAKKRIAKKRPGRRPGTLLTGPAIMPRRS